jgi:hypothetical protein
MTQQFREYKRFSVDFMKINGKMMFESTVDIIDISLGGISLQVDRALKIGVAYLLRIEAYNHAILLDGTVIWSTLGGSFKTVEGGVVPLYSVGMRFNNLTSEKNDELMNFIESHKIEQDSIKMHRLSGLRLSMRVHIASNNKFILTSQESFSVKQISLGGMRIEADHPLELDQVLPMVISLPEDIDLNFAGRVASCMPLETEDTKHFAIGIDFVNMPKEEAEKLKGFIARLS